MNLGKNSSASYIIVLCCALFASAAFAQSDAEFAKANQEYAQGHFKEAISGYEAFVRSGQWSANLFYDLGNAYFRTGEGFVTGNRFLEMPLRVLLVCFCKFGV